MLKDLTPKDARSLAVSICRNINCTNCPFDGNNHKKAGLGGSCAEFYNDDLHNKSETVKQFCNEARNKLLLMMYSDNEVRNQIIRKHLLKKGE